MYKGNRTKTTWFSNLFRYHKVIIRDLQGVPARVEEGEEEELDVGGSTCCSRLMV